MLVTNAKEEVTRVTEVSPRVDQNAVYKMQKRAPTITDFLKALWKIQKNCVLDDNSKMQARTRGIANDQKKFRTYEL
jgi:phage terminase large subunit-like protein